ncbi:hypothetical protein HYZ99_03360 [Candidatus Peregrinibacteria bacterium]|nr:hypothetical protein [Candidatus Peregrinibacteria bacterium]
MKETGSKQTGTGRGQQQDKSEAARGTESESEKSAASDVMKGKTDEPGSEENDTEANQM